MHLVPFKCFRRLHGDKKVQLLVFNVTKTFPWFFDGTPRKTFIFLEGFSLLCKQQGPFAVDDVFYFLALKLLKLKRCTNENSPFLKLITPGEW